MKDFKHLNENSRMHSMQETSCYVTPHLAALFILLAFLSKYFVEVGLENFADGTTASSDFEIDRKLH